MFLLCWRSPPQPDTPTLPCQYIWNTTAFHCPGTETTEGKPYTRGKHNADNGNASDVRPTSRWLDKYMGECTEPLVAIPHHNRFEHISGNGRIWMAYTIYNKTQDGATKQEYQHTKQPVR